MDETRIDSHMMFPEFMLKAFYKGGKVLYLDASKGIIEDGGLPSVFNTRKGYYSSDNENILNSRTESKMSNVARRLAKCAKRLKIEKSFDVSDKLLTKEDDKCVRAFMVYQAIRDPANMEATLRLNKSSLSVKDIQNGFIDAENRFEQMPGSFTSEIDNAFSGCMVVLNCASCDFIAVNVGLHMEIEGKKIYFIAVNPKVGFVLHNSAVDKNIYVVYEKSSVDVFNMRMMGHAICYEPHVVIGSNLSYLIELFYKTKKMIVHTGL